MSDTPAPKQKSMKQLEAETNARFGAIETQLSGFQTGVMTTLAEFTEMLKGMSAQDRPSRRESQYKDVRDGDEQSDFVAHDGPEGIVKAQFQSIHDPLFKLKADETMFMEEMVKVHISEVGDEHADPCLVVWVNGKGLQFWRGMDYIIPRKYVNVMAEAKPVHYKNEEYTAADGTRGVRWPGKRGLRYPFEVVDDSQRGRLWLKKLRAA